ncbi:MAG TPA: hypothetical protein VH395_04345, partial [Jatrophihabitantaceae bacterium]
MHCSVPGGEEARDLNRNRANGRTLTQRPINRALYTEASTAHDCSQSAGLGSLLMRLAVIPGDGIGIEVTEQALHVLN